MGLSRSAPVPVLLSLGSRGRPHGSATASLTARPSHWRRHHTAIEVAGATEADLSVAPFPATSRCSSAMPTIHEQGGSGSPSSRRRPLRNDPAHLHLTCRRHRPLSLRPTSSKDLGLSTGGYVPIRVHELARQLGITSQHVLRELERAQIHVRSASSVIDERDAVRLKRLLGQPDPSLIPAGTAPSRSSWRAGAVPVSEHPDTIAKLRALRQQFRVAGLHQEALGSLGSQFVYAAPCKIQHFEDCSVALVRFSGALEAAFGFTREVAFFYSPYSDLQIRTFKAAKQTLKLLSREVTPDIIFFYSPDVRLREKLDDWSSGNFRAIPLSLSSEEGGLEFVSLLRDYIFSRDLFYETTPVRGDRFFGRKPLLQGMRDDIRNQRVVGLFGLRKAGWQPITRGPIHGIGSFHRTTQVRTTQAVDARRSSQSSCGD